MAHNRFYRIGEPGSGLKLRGEIQDFFKIKDTCLENKTLFVDEMFPADQTSIDPSGTQNYEWKRPQEITQNPVFHTDGATRFDIIQGKLGNCWVLSAMTALTVEEKLFNRVVPLDQSFSKNYAGVFHFRIWQFGTWIDVVVDDRIPVDRKTGKFIYNRSSTKNEFWSILLEKAYAKLYGCYSAISGGWGREAMVDFTGGIPETFDPSIMSEMFILQLFKKAKRRKSLLSCALINDAKPIYGLIKGHAYSITGFGTTSTSVNLIRIRNPWGNSEWFGPWSDKSVEWEAISAEEKERLEFVIGVDGEFWISMKDFLQYFNFIEVCNLTPEQLNEDMTVEERKKHWDITLLHGKWVKGVTSGGSVYTDEIFGRNPQYRITLTDPDSNDDEDSCDCLCTVVICLMQKFRRRERKTNLAIGFAVYKIPDSHLNVKPLDPEFLQQKPLFQQDIFQKAREITKTLRLPVGSYCIIPHTQKRDMDGEFVIRIYAVKNAIIEENEHPVHIVEIDEALKEPIEINEVIKNAFYKYADDEEINSEQLMSLYVETLMKDLQCMFTPDMFRSMIGMMDINHSGRLNFEEFILLIRNLKLWKKVFRLYDIDSSGNMNVEEFRAALRAAGYVVNSRILNILVHRYGSEGIIELHNFIYCIIRFKTIVDLFSVKTPNEQQIFTLNEWVATVLVC